MEKRLDIISKKVVSLIQEENGYIRNTKTNGIIPTGIFIWFVKDKEKGLYSLDEKWLRNEKTDDKN